MKDRIKYIVLFIAVIIGAYFLSFLIINIKTIKYGDNISIINLESLLEKDENGNYIFEKDKEYIIEYDNYIKKIQFNQVIDKSVMFEIKFNYNGQELKKEYIGSNKYINLNSIDLNKKVDSFSIKFDDEVKIENMKIDNSLTYISYFQIISIIAGICIYFLIVFRKKISCNPEYTFLIISISVGAAFIFGTPVGLYKSWDDQIHFDNSYTLSEETYSYTSLAFIDLESKQTANTFDENVEYIKFLNDNDNNYTSANTHGVFQISSLGYLMNIFSYKLRSIFGYNWVIAHYMAMILNLLIYIIPIFFAIKYTPVGKYIILFVGLIPTMIFMVTNYSYDPPVVSFMMLGLAFAFREILNNDKNSISTKNILISSISFILCSASKPIYIPIILVLLLVPKDRIPNNKKLLYRLNIILLLFIMFSSFIFPMMLGGVTTDVRGGSDVDGAKQISFIIHNPLRFSLLFINNIYNNFSNRFFWDHAFSSFAYMSRSVPKYNNYNFILYILLFLSVLSSSSIQKRYLSKRVKIVIALILVFIICEIWGSLYISFTPVGSNIISGVQSRYFIPLIYPLLLLLTSNKFKLKMDVEKYNFVISIMYFISIFGTIIYGLAT